MSINYTITNIKNKRDLENKTRDYRDNLALRAQLNRNYEEAMNQRWLNEKLNISPIEEPEKSINEYRQDKLLQTETAMKELRQILSPEQATRAYSLLVNKGDTKDTHTMADPRNLLFLHQHFNEIKDIFKNKRLVDADYFAALFYRYKRYIETLGGSNISIPLQEETILALPSRLQEKWQELADGYLSASTKNYTMLIEDTAAKLGRSIDSVRDEVAELKGLSRPRPRLIPTEGPTIEEETTGELFGSPPTAPPPTPPVEEPMSGATKAELKRLFDSKNYFHIDETKSTLGKKVYKPVESMEQAKHLIQTIHHDEMLNFLQTEATIAQLKALLSPFIVSHGFVIKKETKKPQLQNYLKTIINETGIGGGHSDMSGFGMKRHFHKKGHRFNPHTKFIIGNGMNIGGMRGKLKPTDDLIRGIVEAGNNESRLFEKIKYI